MKWLPFIFISTVLAGCATYDNVMNKTRDKAEKLGEHEIKQAMAYTPAGKSYKSINFTERLYVPKLEENQRNMEKWFFKDWYSASSKLSLSDYMQEIQTTHGVNVRYLEQVDLDKKFPLYFTGTIGEAIEHMALATGFSYHIESNVISWSKYKEETFDLNFLAGKQSFNLGGDENSSKSAASSNSLGSVEVARMGSDDSASSYSNFKVEDLDQFEQLEASINVLKSKTGTYSLDKASSLLLVRDIPESIRNIRRFVTSYKKKVTTNILIEIKVIEFSKSNGVNNSVNWNLVNKTLSDAGVLSLQSAFTTPLVSTVAPLMLGYNRTGGSNAGSQVLIEALQSQGTVTTVSEPQILTVSNRMSNVNIGRDQGFAASSGKSVGGLSSVSQDQITPGILETGTNIFVFPTIDTETDEITVQLNTSFRDFNKFNTFESGQSRIQTPDTNKRKFDLTFVAKSGQTWLVTGYKSKRIESESSHSGFDIPFLDILLGGSKRSRDVYTETMLLITPRILGKK